jgi:hypothetical protein
LTLTLIGLLAVGMAMHTVRAAAELGWLDLDQPGTATLQLLAAPDADALRWCAGLVGLVPETTPVEGAAWALAVGLVVASVSRWWRAAAQVAELVALPAAGTRGSLGGHGGEAKSQ